MKQVGFFEMIMNHSKQFPFYRSSEKLIDSPILTKQASGRKEIRI